MKLTGIGKLVVFILAIGLALGGWRWWQQQQTSDRGNTPLVKTPGQSTPGQSTPGTTIKGAPTTVADNEILFVITPAKKGWVSDQIKAFNEKSAGKYKVVTAPAPSREGMHAILNGSIKPILWSPGSSIWPQRLSEVWKARNASTLIDMNDPNGHRTFLRSPLVFLTTKQKAKFLRPLLSGTQSWQMIRELSLGKRRAPWGKFKFSHADPNTSSSGAITLSLILADYGQRTGQSGALDRLATDKKFWQYATELEKGFVYDKASIAGTTALTKSFIADPSRYDFIIAYENTALDFAADNPNLTVIYPNPTAVSEGDVTFLSGAGWITPTQREGALAFIAFLGSREALEDGLKYHFRPAQSGGDLSLNPVLSRFSEQGFSQSYSSIELPSYQALNTAIFQWRLKVAGKSAG